MPETVSPLASRPSPRLFELAADVATPALVYDLPGIMTSIDRLRSDIGIVPGAALNMALKACHTPGMLARLAATGIGADVASVGELDLALEAGFTELSATGPAFSVAHFARFRAAGIVVDLDSIGQIAGYGRAFPDTDVGLRIRIPLPRQFESNATFGADSRFGVTVTDPEVHAELERHDLRLTRLHAHCGQMSPESMLYNATYQLEVAATFPDVHTLDLGGGFFALYVDRARAVRAFRRLANLVEEWQQKHGRSIRLRFEPGGALLAPYGYLFTEVRNVEAHHPYLGTRVVTVDASAWNLAPWHKPTVVAADLDAAVGPSEEGMIAGDTLYEGDFFGVSTRGRGDRFSFPKVSVGDRLAITASGAYTMTNSRRFNRIPPPTEYAFDGDRLVPLRQAPFT